MPATRDYHALAARVIAAAEPLGTCRVYGQQVTPDESEAYDLLIVRVPVKRARFHVMINGGTHGDEPAGAEAVTQFLEQRRYERWPGIDFTITPCTNPWGYVHNRREGPGGVDLNRSFRRARKRTPQVSLLKRALRGRRFDLYLDCHEDVDTPGLYVFAPPALGRAIVGAVRAAGPIHEGDLVDGEIPLNQGVVELHPDRVREWSRGARTWALPMYIARYHRRLPAELRTANALAAGGEGGDGGDGASAVGLLSSATIETPTFLPLEQRAAMHLMAIDAALATLTDK